MIQRALLRKSKIAWSPVQSSSSLAFILPHSKASTFLSTRVSRQIPTTRWYATEPEIKQTTTGEQETSSPQQDSIHVDDTIKKDLEAKNKEISDLKDKYLRSVADFRNLQERTKREVQSAKDFAIQKFAKDLVESVDNLDRALAMVPEERLTASEKSEHLADLVNLYEGLKMTETILMQTLKKHGLERFDPSTQGLKFDPNEMMATFTTPVVGKEDNTVFHTESKGYRLNGRVLRAAKVGVVKNA